MECTNGLLSSEEVNATIQNVWPVPLIGLEFQDWIFPSAKFTCNGYITNLTLQLVLIGNPEDSTTTLATTQEIQIWRKNSDTSSETDYVMVNHISLQNTTLKSSGSVIEYQLSNPTPVEEGDVLGYAMHINSSSLLNLNSKLAVLRLESGENMSHTDTLSYRRTSASNPVFDIDISGLNQSNTVFLERNIVPLVAATIVQTSIFETTRPVASLLTTESASFPTDSIVRTMIIVWSVIGVVLFFVLHVLCLLLIVGLCCMRKRCVRQHNMSTMKLSSQRSTDIKVYVPTTNSINDNGVTELSPVEMQASTCNDAIVTVLNDVYSSDESNIADHEYVSRDGDSHTNIYETLTRDAQLPNQTGYSECNDGYVAFTNQEGNIIDEYSYVNDPTNDPDVRIPVKANSAYVAVHHS